MGPSKIDDLVQFRSGEVHSGPACGGEQVVDGDPTAGFESDPDLLRRVAKVLAQELAQMRAA